MLLSAFDSCIQSAAIFKQERFIQQCYLIPLPGSSGVIWIGSCDGLNIFDGTNIHVYNPANPTKASLSGNLINDIMETEKEVLWIQTNYGLDRLDTKHQTSKSFTEFKDKNYMAKSRDNDLFIVKTTDISITINRKSNSSKSWKYLK